MRIADLSERVSFIRLGSITGFYKDCLQPEDTFLQWANVKDKGITEADENGHIHEIRELIVTVRSSQKTRKLDPDRHVMVYHDHLYDITHIEEDSRYRRWVTLHARRKSHGSKTAGDTV